MTDWEALARREEERYRDGLERMPDDPDGRQKQLVRMANAALGAGLSRLMQGRRAEASGWLARAAQRYRESYASAPPESWGRLIGAVKARVLADDRAGAEEDARWVLEQGAAGAESPIGRYAGTLAQLVLGDDRAAARLSASLRAEAAERFPAEVAEALAGLADRDVAVYRDALERVLRSFETRDAYLEDVPVADTVIVLDALAERRDMAVRAVSTLLPARV